MSKFCFIFFLILSFETNSQEFSYNEYGINDGLPSSVLYRVIQDQLGFIWVNSENGVSKFDGTKFRNFTTNEGLPKNDIWEIDVDSKNRIWIAGYYKGLYYIQNDSIKYVKNSNSLGDIGTIIFRSEINDTCYFEVIREKKLYYLNKKGTLEKSVRSVTGNMSKFPTTKENSNRIIRTFTERYADKNTKVEGKDFAYNKNGEWIKGNLDQYFGGDVVLFQMINPTPMVVVVVNGQLRVYDNITSLNRNRKLELKINQVYEREKSLKWLYLDDEENLWITTYKDHLIFIPFYNDQIENYLEIGLNNSGSIISADQNAEYLFLLTSASEVVTFEKKNKRYKIKELNYETFPSQHRGIKIIGSDVFINARHTLTKLSNNQITYSKYKDNLDIGEPLYFLNNEMFYSGNLAKYQIKQGNIIQLEKEKINDRNSVLLKSSKTILAGGINGVYLYYYKNKTLKQIPFFDAVCGHTIQNGYLLGTSGNGMFYLDFNGKIIDSLYKGLSINDITSYKDYLFVATNNGLYVNKIINNQIVQLKRFGFIDGLTSDEIVQVCADENSIYAITSKELNIIRMSVLKKSKKSAPPKLIFTDVKVNEISSINKHHFGWNENTFQFIFKGLSYSSLGRVTYLYKLKEVDNDWIKSQENTVRYPNLPSGNYTFLLKAVSANGVKSELKSYHFSIRPHYTQTLWFRMILGALFLVLLFYIFYTYQKRKNKKLIIQKQLSELELKALRSQMNPHFIFNSLSAIQSVVFLKGEREANRYIGTFSSLIRKTLDNSKSDKITLRDELEYLELYLKLEKYRLNDNLKYKIEVDDNINLDDELIYNMIIQPLAENAIIHGLASKKGERELIISLSKDSGMLIVKVEDNGIGRAAAEKLKKDKNYKSWASTIMNERIKVMNRLRENKISFEIFDLESNSIPSGTRIIIKIPL